jgi:hypothetical protein
VRCYGYATRVEERDLFRRGHEERASAKARVAHQQGFARVQKELLVTAPGCKPCCTLVPRQFEPLPEHVAAQVRNDERVMRQRRHLRHRKCALVQLYRARCAAKLLSRERSVVQLHQRRHDIGC